MSNLSEYIHPKSINKINNWLNFFKTRLIISEPSRTRLGVFIPKHNSLNRIIINNDLNQYAFLITLVHELAHASIWKKFGSSVRPHGQEWKDEFRKMMIHFLNPEFFPKDILRKLSHHLINPSSSVIRDISLSQTLQKYDNRDIITINQINDGDVFKSLNGKKFKRVCRMRKNYKCIELSSNRLYRFSPLTEIIIL